MIDISELPLEIRQESEALLNELAALGWEITAAMYEATFYGDWFVDLHRAGKSIRLIKENALFTFENFVETETEDPEPVTYETFVTFHSAVADWAGTQGPSLVR